MDEFECQTHHTHTHTSRHAHIWWSTFAAALICKLGCLLLGKGKEESVQNG